MNALSPFLDFNLPNATTWFYFSALLAIALFFKFSRVLSLRNWDVVLMFLLVPGLLVIQNSRAGSLVSERHPAVQLAGLIGQETAHALGAPAANLTSAGWLARNGDPGLSSGRWQWWGYLWLLCGSAYFLLRCLLDLTLVQRPALAPNLSFGGLAWLAGALFICLVAVAFRAPDQPARAPHDPPGRGTQVVVTTVGSESASLAHLREQLEAPWWFHRAFAILGHLIVVVGLVLIGVVHFKDPTAGMAAATFYLMLPYTGIYVGQVHHVWPMALVLWAIVCFRSPIIAGGLLGLAAGAMYYPAVLVPIWISFYWKRGMGRFLFSFLLIAGIYVLVSGINLWLHDKLDSSIREALANTAWQPWKVPTTEGIWTGVHGAYRIPIFIAYVALVLLTAAWPWPKNLAQVMSLSAAVLIGIQFWYADQGGVYVLWYLPLLLLLVFRPNLEDRRPAPIQPETDWLARSGRAVVRLVRRGVKQDEPVKAK